MTTSKLAALVLLAAFFGCDSTNPYDFMMVPDAGCEADLTTPEGYAKALKCGEFRSCVYKCGGCSEPEQPYACPALRPWKVMAHADACGDFDGTKQPAPVTGVCTATMPSGDAVGVAGPDTTNPRRLHLPDGHFIEPAGNEQVLHPKGVASGFPLNVILVPGSVFAIVSDGGVDDNALYAVDLDKLAAGQPAVVSTVVFPSPTQLEFGLAFASPNRIFASGGADGTAYAFTIDLGTGALARLPSADVGLGPSTSGSAATMKWHAGALAMSVDGASLVVVPSTGESALRVIDLGRTKPEVSIDLGAKEIFDVIRDPSDAGGATFWVTALDTRSLLRVDLATRTVTARLPTGKNPEGIAFLDSTHVAVAASDDDTIAVYDPVSGQALQTLHLDENGRTGAQPGALAYDPATRRLYATLSGVNALAVLDFDLGGSLTLGGKVPTAWWPTAVRVRQDGSLVVLTGKGHGSGPATLAEAEDDGALTHGSIALVPRPSAADLVGMTAIAQASRRTTTDLGYPTVICPAGAAYDFPIPLTNSGAVSAQIKHVVYVVRENKTFDSVFGDLKGVNGDPTLVMSPGKMDEYWANARAIGGANTLFDNYYTDAEQSLQGHIWNTYGRSTDFIERTWSATWGRHTRQPTAGIDTVVGSPREGSLFAWAERNEISYDDMGEIVGLAANGFDPGYPGLIYAQAVPDTEKACYVAARARATCDLKSITYVGLPNDHTLGLQALAPTPQLMIAVNDEATGMLLDALSHSPIWATTLFIVTEDDPQGGADHVEDHRTPLFMASPWLKRGFVSKTHIDASSLHKLFAHIFARPYQSEEVADAALPFDAFTSTPDFTPYTYKPHSTPTACNPGGTKQASLAAQWDFTDPDDQPGLSGQVSKHMRAMGASK